MFHKCSDKCLCASSQPGGKETVLYCYGEVRYSNVVSQYILHCNIYQIVFSY